MAVDAAPEGLEDAIEGLDSVRSRRLRKGRKG